MNFIHGQINDGHFIADGGCKIPLTPDQKKLLRHYEGKRIVYGIRPENLVYSKDDSFAKHQNYSFTIKKNNVEKLGDVVNVHCKLANDKIIVKMNSKFFPTLHDELNVAIDVEYARFFNESTTKAITLLDCQYEESDQVINLDDDNVVIIK